MISFKITCSILIKPKQLLSKRSLCFSFSGYRLRGSQFVCRKFHSTMPLPFERLPKNVVPKEYDITIKPDLKKFIFDGKVRIKCNVLEATSNVCFNALDLEISSVTYEGKEGKEIFAENVDIILKDEKAIANFSVPLPLGEGHLSMDFNGNLTDKMKGFYRSKYKIDGEERYAAVSQFEAVDARRAFPCWDEPAIKSIFNITLIVPKDRVALSNMNVIADNVYQKDSSLRVVKFAPSPTMSTYLVAMIVGEYEYIEERSKNDVLVRVYTPIGKKEQGRFSLEVAIKALSFFEEYFNISYPLPKLDLIALADFSSGAMENWGLVTYREVCLLVDPKNSSTLMKQDIAIVVAHELAHQWFGNLVTMEWWTHLWLNEGFATFMEFLCVDHVLPVYNIWTQFITDTLTDGLELDALKSSHPIEVKVNHPSEIDEIFDVISYKKGASIIRMLHNFIGAKHFQKGLHNYLTQFSYNNTSTEDLWNAFNKSSGQCVGKIMQSWTNQTGFPLISVSSITNGNEHTLKISQEKFRFQSAEEDNTKWIIPISFSTQADPNSVVKQVLLEDKTMEVKFENIAADHWIKLNPGIFGFYRVQYSSEMLQKFLPSIYDETLPALDRLSLQNDLFAMIQIGRVSTTEALTLMECFENETNYNVWSSISQCLGTLKILLDYTDSLPNLLKFGCKLLSKNYSHIGWDAKPNESHLDTLLRSLVIGRLVSFQHTGVLEEAKKRFQAHIDGTAIIPSDLRSAVYRAVVSQGEEKIFNQMVKLYTETDMQEEKGRIGRSLGTFKDKCLLKKAFEFAFSDNVRPQDALSIIVAASMSKESHYHAWSFFKEKKAEFRKRYEGNNILAIFLKRFIENFCTEEMEKEVKEFFEINQFPGTERSIEQSLESIDMNKQWLARDTEAIAKWLQSRQ